MNNNDMRVISEEELSSAIFIHHGHENLERDRFIGAVNVPMISKPRGCFWGSPHTPNEEFASPWEEFFVDGFSAPIVAKYASCSFKFKIKPGAKILVLDNKEDIEKLKEKYTAPQDEQYEFLDMKVFRWVLLDWQKIAKDYDGAYFTHNATYELYHVLYGWDVESICLFNLEYVEQI